MGTGCVATQAHHALIDLGLFVMQVLILSQRHQLHLQPKLLLWRLGIKARGKTGTNTSKAKKTLSVFKKPIIYAIMIRNPKKSKWTQREPLKNPKSNPLEP